MSVEANKAVVRRWFDAWTRRDLPAVEACYADGRSEADREAEKDTFTRWHAAFSDLRWEIEDLVAEGDLVAVNSLTTGTHDGLFHWSAFGPWPATGRRVVAREIFFIRLVNGRIVQMTATWNPIDFMQQLGVPLPLVT